MCQALLPMIPAGATRINQLVSVVRKDGKWTYFCGVKPVFSHAETDRQSFRLITAQLVSQGTCKQVEIISTFGVSKNSVRRSVIKFCEGGTSAFFQKRKGRGVAVMTEEVAASGQQLLDAGKSKREVADALGIKYDTLRKAIDRGQLCEHPVQSEPAAASDKSQRTQEDAAAEMGTACTRPGERVLAALGLLSGASTLFEPCRDVSFGGALCALPALTESGLFRHLDRLPNLSGYYTTLHVMTLLAYMALCRIKAVEQLQYEPPGELGKLLGLDRIPEVRCLRKKLAQLSLDNAPQEWAGLLSQDWLSDAPELAGTLYVDGHVRLYHGHKTKLPKKYVSRQRLCLRGITDYWVNDALGQPFFLVERSVDHGLLEVLRNDIVPRLLQEVPNQPTEQELKETPHRSRFVIVFDREGYSPVFFKEMWQKHRIACITYHKYPKEDWPEEEFTEKQLALPSGEQISLMMAERGSWIGNQQTGLWVREIRKLSRKSHQTSLVSTAYEQQDMNDAALLFSRWSQENFFQYMMENFAIDALNEYRTEEFPGTTENLRNPAWRELDNQLRSVNGKLKTRRARFAALTLHPEADEKDVAKWEQNKAEALEEVEQLEHEREEIKKTLKETPKHVSWEALPEEHKFERLAPSRKQLVDTVKMLAYRAETAMSLVVREHFSHKDEARALLRELFRSDADILPDVDGGVLNVRIHGLANPRSNRAIGHLLNQLNAGEWTYPGTRLRLCYTIADQPES